MTRQSCLGQISAGQCGIQWFAAMKKTEISGQTQILSKISLFCRSYLPLHGKRNLFSISAKKKVQSHFLTGPFYFMEANHCRRRSHSETRTSTPPNAHQVSHYSKHNKTTRRKFEHDTITLPISPLFLLLPLPGSVTAVLKTFITTQAARRQQKHTFRTKTRAFIANQQLHFITSTHIPHHLQALAKLSPHPPSTEHMRPTSSNSQLACILLVYTQNIHTPKSLRYGTSYANCSNILVFGHPHHSLVRMLN